MDCASVGVLLLEDHDALRRVITRVLAREGFEVQEAATLLQAIAVLRGTRAIDLVIEDLGVPGRDDTQEMDAFHGLSEGIPKLFTSGYSRAQAEDRYGLATTDEFMAKPFCLQELVVHVHRLIDDAEPSGEVTSSGGSVRFASASA